MSRSSIVGLLAALAALCAPAAAQADNIAYVKDANVWIANPDGSGAYQVTTDGTATDPYRSPSQADDGTLVASHGSEIVRMRQNGSVVNRFDPAGSVDSAGVPIDGVPQDVAISPDGSKVAFTFYTYNCPVGVSCQARQVTRYAAADGSNPGYGRLFLANPSWVSNDRVLVFGGFGHQVNVDRADEGTDDDVHWFDDQDVFSPSTDLGDGELSRAGDRLALVRGYGADAQLVFYAVHGDVAAGGTPPLPDPACWTGNAEGLAGPSWSPDGRAVAFQQPEGVEVMPLPSVVPGGCPGASSSTLVLPGASEPDWGPAPVNPGPREAAPPAGSGSGDAHGGGSLRATAARKLKLSQAVRKGIVVTVNAPAAGRLDVVARLGRKTVAKRLKITSPGAVTIRIPVSARLARQLARRAKTRVAIQATLHPAGGAAPIASSLSVTLLR
jgi:opacity protein-like surface antigen